MGPKETRDGIHQVGGVHKGVPAPKGQEDIPEPPSPPAPGLSREDQLQRALEITTEALNAQGEQVDRLKEANASLIRRATHINDEKLVLAAQLKRAKRKLKKARRPVAFWLAQQESGHDDIVKGLEDELGRRIEQIEALQRIVDHRGEELASRLPIQAIETLEVKPGMLAIFTLGASADYTGTGVAWIPTQDECDEFADRMFSVVGDRFDFIATPTPHTTAAIYTDDRAAFTPAERCTQACSEMHTYGAGCQLAPAVVPERTTGDDPEYDRNDPRGRFPYDGS